MRRDFPVSSSTSRVPVPSSLNTLLEKRENESASTLNKAFESLSSRSFSWAVKVYCSGTKR